MLRKDNTPGGLASELAAARAKRDLAVEAADRKLADTRDRVIDTAITRQEAIAQLQIELDAEAKALDEVVKSA